MQGGKIGSEPYDDPTQGRQIGSDPYDDPTQGRVIGSAPYDDPNPEQGSTGRLHLEAVSFIDIAFPGLTFTLGGPIDAHHNQARFQWHVRRAVAPDAYVGFDVIVAEDGRDRNVYGFMDAAPAA